MILKCCMGKRVGFLSGAPYQARVNGGPNPRITRGRVIFGMNGLLFIIFTLTLIFLGFGNLEETTNELGDGVSVSTGL